MTQSGELKPHELPLNICKRLKRRVRALKWRQKELRLTARATVKTISDILEIMESKLSATEPLYAWEVVDVMLRNDSELLYSVDDSKGVLGEVISRLPDRWVENALRSGNDAHFWKERVMLLLNEDEFGYRGKVLEKCAPLFGRDMLEQMAGIFSEQINKEKSAIRDDDFFTDRRPLHHAVHLLQSCAVALGDPFVYEDAVRREYDREPEGMHLIDCAKMFMRFGNNSEALVRLRNVDDEYLQTERDALLAKLQEKPATGNS